MRRMLGWIAAALCCVARAAAGETSLDARLQEAQRAFDAAIKLDKAGKYAEAVAQSEHALVLREAVLGGSHPEVADCLNHLGRLHRLQGDMGRAEPLLQRGLDIREAALGKNHPSVAASLNNLAGLYNSQGLYSRAEQLYKRALTINEAALGKKHPTVAAPLNNLANLYKALGWYGRAEPLLQRALAIREAAFGENHPTVAASLNNLANLYAAQGSYGRAQPLYERALAIREAALDKNHPDVAQSLNNLANLYATRGWYSRAEPLYERALAIREASLGQIHPAIAASLNNLAVLRLAQQRLDAAVPLFARAFAMSEQRLRQEALDFSGERLASFLQFLRTEEERLYALLRAHPDNASIRRLVLSAALLLKGRSVAETADISHAIYRSLNAQEHDTFEHLRGLHTRLAQLSLQGPGTLPPADYQQQLRELTEQAETLEASLARRSAPLRALATLPSPADIVDRVAWSLPKDGVLIEFITYEDRPLLPTPGRPKARLRYLALLLFPDGSTRALDLGPAEPIDSAASNLRHALANRDAFQPASRALYRLAFQPLLPLLGENRHIFLSPDGELGFVPFAALHDGRQFLVDSFDFTYLTSGRDLLPRIQEPTPAGSVVVLADPDFSAPLQPSTAGVARASPPARRSISVEQVLSPRSAGLAQRAWATTPLPGTRLEAESIQRLLPQAQLFLGPEATKERLLGLSTPGILHLATHGFFLEDAPAAPSTRAIGHFGALGEDPLASPPPDPLLRSGLLLAGARAPASSGSSATPPPPDSALVTALELVGLDLWGTQLVVLSACNTARGDVRLGQGVYGLRRAFVVAGAETVVMSLWMVDDKTTSTLMEDYYRHLLAGQGRAAALHTAMRSLRSTRPHPYYWAPFITLGRDTPLRMMRPVPPTEAVTFTEGLSER